MRIALFFCSVTAMVSLVHLYLWMRLVRDTAIPPVWATAATRCVVVLASSLPLSFPLLRLFGPHLIGAALFPVFVWMGTMLLLLVFLLAADLIRLGIRTAGRLAPPLRGPVLGRRVFIARAIASTALVAAGPATCTAIRTALDSPVIRRVEVGLARLPRSLDQTTIVQLTDLHLGPTLRRQWLERIVERVNALAPDLVAITGDLVDGRVNELLSEVRPLSRLRARSGIFFVTGNHEYYSGAPEWVRELPRMGVSVLRNERVQIGTGPASFDLAGIDDYAALQMMVAGHGPDLERAVLGRDTSRALVLLAHQPRAVHDASRLGVGLQLSGHTHGGQIWPFHHLVRLNQPLVSGLARFGPTWLYVSEGTGFWGPPMRLGTACEITLVVLRALDRLNE